MREPGLAPAFPVPPALRERAAPVRLVLLDVDGVLTDGNLYIGADGAETKAFHVRDGHGIKLLRASGVELGVITARTSKAVEHRMADLGIRHVYQGCQEKYPVYRRLLAELGLTAAQTAYAGDDVVDLPILLDVGLAVTPADAHPLVRQHAHWATPNPGGRGAVRDLCELLLYAQDHYEAALLPYLLPARD